MVVAETEKAEKEEKAGKEEKEGKKKKFHSTLTPGGENEIDNRNLDLK